MAQAIGSPSSSQATQPSTTAPTTTVPTTTTTSWGVDAGNHLIGPAGMNVDLGTCPAGWADNTGVTAEQILIGQTAPLAGSLAAGFAPITAAFDAYIARVNAEGGIGGRRIVVAREDDGYLPSQTPAAAARLRDQGVLALAGGIGTGQAIAASADANAACVPQLFPFGGHPGLANPAGQPWTAGAFLTFNAEPYLWAEHIARSHPAGARIAIISIDNDYGRAFESALTAAAARHAGLQVVGPFRHKQDGSDGGARAAEVIATGAEVVVAATAAQGCTTIVAGAAGASVERYLASGCSVTTVGATGQAQGWLQISGLVDPAAAPADHPAVVRYRAAMASAGIDPASLPAWNAFYLADTLVESLRAANERPGGLTRTNLLLAVRSLRLQHPALPAGVTLHLNGNLDGNAVEGGTLLRYTTGANREAVATIDLDGIVPTCAWRLDTLACS